MFINPCPPVTGNTNFLVFCSVNDILSSLAVSSFITISIGYSFKLYPIGAFSSVNLYVP